jgi:hypothetical protein
LAAGGDAVEAEAEAEVDVEVEADALDALLAQNSRAPRTNRCNDVVRIELFFVSLSVSVSHSHLLPAEHRL